MSILYYLPLVLSFPLAISVVFGDYSLWSKIFVGVFIAAAAAMQVIPDLQKSIHFLIPLYMEVAVGVWWVIVSHME